MRVFLSKFLLTIFIAIFAVPSSLLASPGNNWTPPVGGPTVGTNVPAPVNIGPNAQTKEGALRVNRTLTAGADFKVDFGSILSGGTFFDNDTDMGGGDFMASFVPATFLNQVNVGQSTSGVEFNLFGRLKYKPINANGSDVQGGQPGPGRVLKATDTLGNMVWGDALPGATNNGDTLIWSVACNCWTTGPGGGGGGTGNLPSGTAGQTMWYNGATNAWEATDQIKHDTVVDQNGATQTRSKINNYLIDIPAHTVLVGHFSDPTSLTHIRSEETKITGGKIILGKGTTNDSSSTSFYSDNIVFKIPQQITQQGIDINSDVVNFNDPINNGNGGPQAVTFNSSSVKFKGPAQNPALLDAGIGRIPMSVDADGTFKWNKYLTYGNIPFAPGLNLGQLTLANPENGIAAFANQGITWLGDDIILSEGGDLYLEGLEGGSYSQWASGQIKHLCYLEGTKKVVTCPATTLPEDTLPGTVTTPVGVGGAAGDGSTIFTPEDNGSQYTFNFTGTVSVKYCGGGGGGGGGGIGDIGNNLIDEGAGGAGGGGGSKGQCYTEDLDVNQGDVLSWNIGQGGQGGGRGYFGITPGTSVGPLSATSGQPGISTAVFFDPAGSPASSQLGNIAAGGFGGGPGASVFEGFIGSQPPWDDILLPGPNGDPLLPASNLPLLPNGSQYPQGKFHGVSGNSSDAGCGSCGGVGGWGESLDSQGNLIENLDGAQASARGVGGVYSYINENQQNPEFNNSRAGGNGRSGNLSFGGGGGGGSFGGMSNSFSFTMGALGAPNGDKHQIAGGNGGNGGNGYVYIYGLPTQNQVNEIVYSTPGTFSLTPAQEISIIPADVQNFTVEVWGAGGGAGGIKTSNTEVRRAGGGGTGGYRTMTLSRNNLFNAEFVVGAKGANGTNTSSSGTPTDGVAGGLSQVRNQAGAPGFQALGADGGAGGTAWINTGNAGQGGAGGDQFPNGYPAGVTVGADGVDGASNSGPCNLAQETITSNNGFGAGSPRTCTDGTLNIYQGSAQNGRIRISW